MKSVNIKIIKREFHSRGKLLKIRVNDKTVSLIITFHAQRRIERWGIPESKLLETLLFPEKVIVGHRSRFIAHRRYGRHLIRAVYDYEAKDPVLITAYFPFANRYFQGGGQYEDKILT